MVKYKVIGSHLSREAEFLFEWLGGSKMVTSNALRASLVRQEGGHETSCRAGR